jgi:hypothetical protein
VHQYDPAVIDDYVAQLAVMKQQLVERFRQGKTVVVMGGGGMGAGAEYLKETGQEFEPLALSTQAGFQYSYEFGSQTAAAARPPALAKKQDDQGNLYELLGDFFKQANEQAFDRCGQDYSNWACMCPTEHAIVICLAAQKVGDPADLPSWLQEQHCGNDPAARPDPGFTSYQQLLLGASKRRGDACTQTLRQFFVSVNTPSKGRY